MKSIRFSLSAIWRSVRLFVVACTCALVLFSNVAPAYSLPNPFAPNDSSQTSSSPQEGEEQLRGIEAGAQKTVIRQQDLLSGKEVQRKSAEGLNEVQGAADLEKMKRPENTQAESVEGIIQGTLEEVTGKK